MPTSNARLRVMTGTKIVIRRRRAGLRRSISQPSTAAHVASGVWLADERGLEERSGEPFTPSLRKRSTHLATVFGVVLNWRAAAAFDIPPSTTARTICSRPFGVGRAFL